MKLISYSTLGGRGDKPTLLKLHRQLITSKMDYGEIVYNSAEPSHHTQV